MTIKRTPTDHLTEGHRLHGDVQVESSPRQLEGARQLEGEAFCGTCHGALNTIDITTHNVEVSMRVLHLSCKTCKTEGVFLVRHDSDLDLRDMADDVSGNSEES